MKFFEVTFGLDETILLRTITSLWRKMCSHKSESLATLVRDLMWLLIWTMAASVTLLFSMQMIAKYMNEDTVTIVSYDYKNTFLRPSITICNNVHLDPKKVLRFRKNESSSQLLSLLNSSIHGDYSADDSNFIFDTPTHSFLPHSAATAVQYKLDMDSFFIGCSDYSFRMNCSEIYAVFLDSFQVCYRTKLKHVPYRGNLYSTTALLYFDPEVHLGKYTTSVGATVFISYGTTVETSRGTGLSVGPGEEVAISAQLVSKSQSTSLKRSPCVHLETQLISYNFTGTPFEVVYSQTTCNKLCLWQQTYLLCQCALLVGWNITGTECLEDEAKRECLFSVLRDRRTTLAPEYTSCTEKCVRPCREKYYEIEYSRNTNYPLAAHLVKELQLFLKAGSATSLAHKLDHVIHNESSCSGVNRRANDFAQNVAQLRVFLRDERQTKSIRIEPALDFAELMGHIGGFLGMWMGLSAVTLFAITEKLSVCVATSVKQKLQQMRSKRAQQKEPVKQLPAGTNFN